MIQILKKIAMMGSALLFIASAIFGCGSSASTPRTPAQQQQDTASLAQLALQVSADLLTPSPQAGLQAGLSTSKITSRIKRDTQPTCTASGSTYTCACATSGTIVFADPTVTFHSCHDAGGSTLNGSVSFTTNSNGSERFSFSSFTATDSSGSFSLSGTVDLSVNGDEITFNVAGSADGHNYTLAGPLTINTDGTVTGDISVTGDSFSATCVFDNFDAGTGDYSAACQ